MGELAVVTPSTQGATTQALSLGVRHEDRYGRVYYYAKATTAVGRGKVARAAAVIGNHNNMSFATGNAPAVGDKSVVVTLGGTAATANQYKDGWFVVQDGTGEGRIFKIEGHQAQSSTTGDLRVYLAEPVDIIMAVAESNVDLIYNKYDELLPPAGTSQALVAVGVPNMVGGLGASEFGYIQTWGPCAVWADEATANLGEDMTWGSGTGTGQLEGVDAATEPHIAQAGPAASVADEYQLVYLKVSR